MTGNETVSWTHADRVLRVTLNRPPANALGLPLIEGLHLALDEFDKSDARVLLVESALDGFFAAGADIKLMSCDDRGLRGLRGGAARPAGPVGHPRPAEHRGHRGAGPGWWTGARPGLHPAGQRAQRPAGAAGDQARAHPGGRRDAAVARLVGRGRALDIMLTARDLPAEEAYAIGLIDRLVEPGTAVAEASELAATLRARSGAALTEIMRCVDDAQSLPLAEGLALEADRVTGLFAGAEAQEGLSAFLQKRRPDYR